MHILYIDFQTECLKGKKNDCDNTPSSFIFKKIHLLVLTFWNIKNYTQNIGIYHSITEGKSYTFQLNQKKMWYITLCLCFGIGVSNKSRISLPSKYPGTRWIMYGRNMWVWLIIHSLIPNSLHSSFQVKLVPTFPRKHLLLLFPNPPLLQPQTHRDCSWRHLTMACKAVIDHFCLGWFARSSISWMMKRWSIGCGVSLNVGSVDWLSLDVYVPG